MTEHLDAAEAVHHISLEDRDTLKYTLAATLVKSSSHWRVFRDRLRGLLRATFRPPSW